MRDHTDDIKPRIDEHGVGWCDAGCLIAIHVGTHDCTCNIDSMNRWFNGRDLDACPHHARRVAAERDELKEELARHQRTTEFQSQQYLAAHGGSWGECKYKAELDRLRVECEAWRSGRIVTYTGDLVVDRILLWNKTLDGFSLYDTIDAAVDALMGERGK